MTKKTILLSAAVIALALGACNNEPKNEVQQIDSQEMHEHESGDMHHHDEDSMHQHDDDTSHNKMSVVIYQCPMHPDVTSTQPGKCPKCGMNLETQN